MLIRIFTLKFHAAMERFDDEAVQAFIKDKELLSVRDHFFIKQDTPYLVLVLTYLPGGDTVKHSGRKKRDAWRDLLADEQMPLFDTLREWRAERAEQDGVPLYIICTNQQLAQMVATRPDTLAGLGKIHGFGMAKAEKYGKAILALLQPAEGAGEQRAGHPPEDSPTAQSPTRDEAPQE
jgi:ATP-dependent DNA helicase RecQ